MEILIYNFSRGYELSQFAVKYFLHLIFFLWSSYVLLSKVFCH